MPRTSKKNGRVGNVYETLKRQIAGLQLKPGALLDERQLMDDLGAGRTLIRESIIRLKNEGLVVGDPNRSSYVRDITLTETRELFEYLMIIEKNVAFLAAKRRTPKQVERIKKIQADFRATTMQKDIDAWKIVCINDDFHRQLAACVDNSFLNRADEQIRSMAIRLAYISFGKEMSDSESLKGHCEIVNRHHDEIVEAIEMGDTERLVEVTLDHLKLFQTRIMKAMTNVDFL